MPNFCKISHHNAYSAPATKNAKARSIFTLYTHAARRRAIYRNVSLRTLMTRCACLSLMLSYYKLTVTPIDGQNACTE